MQSSWEASFFSGEALYATQLNAAVNGSVDDSLTATGTTQGTAYPLTKTVSIFTTVGSGTGALLPQFSSNQVGFFGCIVVANGQSNLLLYPYSGAKINSLSANAPIAIPAGTMAWVFVSSTTQVWVR